MIKIGLIGAGFMGKMHAACYEALKDTGVKITAVSDLSDKNAKEIADKTGAVIYPSGMELINAADVDIIDICLPTYLHTEHAVAAMEKGRNVFIEKPVCMNQKEAELLLDAQKKTGVKVMAGQCLRFWSEYAWLKEVVDNKTYGEIISGSFGRISPKPTWGWNNWLHSRPECESGGVALDLHIHDTDFIRYILGDPLSVNSTAFRDSEGAIQHIFSNFSYPKAEIFSQAGWDYPPDFPFSMEYRVKFEKATVVYNSSSAPTITVYMNECGSHSPKLEEEFKGEGSGGGNLSSLGGYYNELKYFIQAVMKGEQIEISPLSEGIASVLLANKEIESAGGVVKK